MSAWTYNEDEVTAAWPKLSALVWSQLDRWGPVGMKHGVTELAEYLQDALRYGDVSEETKKSLRPGAARVTELLEQMRSALAGWDPRRAEALSNALEEALFFLEKEAPEEFLELK